ncbi:anti-phage defense-associated sirtuin Dsr1 [Cellvibrio japonicus]|uniref:Uncharacterized protein n=1 Tax=Cellvibrio japonicus (strain Ueda107) TaxID=498211 RepID=B3PHQ7_CELJU|nr:anti-phage defense-associated sirtuin Dsr1 [Cellvibrio japonicus]ACE85827.1 Conserved hypothetical protein [Cellvibrio japonicus Ueda107]QEI13853.1 hypothetical protein FY117_17610 [Cellvibrio japonicus]QEI17427.1 hypothetical protein FY116_17615 [Cellvibrio japonicus]QEI21003.1 hypothetical protein FY115_17610 [Cellvibrio japonicus]
MQFVKNGPDIPERLLQLHEDGRVVFFCGAGISYPAKLPGFSGLVNQLFQAVGKVPDAVEQAAIKAGQFDTAVGLLETNHIGGRASVRQELRGILTPDLTLPKATATHEALLTLSKSKTGCTRLITTNFDQLFEEVISRKGLKVERFRAPLLPVPKNRWDGLVYLHGLLTDAPTTSELDRLVISSGDFGLAYLTERWAARFVSELFRNYTVCFVGYSINDPVLRYMMDALAADRLLGESPPEMFAFGSYSKGKKEALANEWRAKNVTPILYRERNHHIYLHNTLHTWANTYRDGVNGKERIVVEYGRARPTGSTKQDDFVSRMLWALSDPSGLPAKRFAEVNPVPPLGWLEYLSEKRYGHADLERFGVPPKAIYDNKLSFNLVSRPPPYDLSPLMTLVDSGSSVTRWDNIMPYLAFWLVRHLNDPALFLWLIKHGGQLHEQLAWQIRHRLKELTEFERNGNADELNRIRADAPNAIPSPMMRTLWNLLLSRCVKSQRGDLYRWWDILKCEGLTTVLRMELREILTPRIAFREPFRSAEGNDNSEPQRIKDIVEWKIELSGYHVHSFLSRISKEPLWIDVLPKLLPDFSILLKDALDLMRELGEERRGYLSCIHQPSIGNHPQNKHFHDWTALIDITRDAWLAMSEFSPERAFYVAEDWWRMSEPVFRRLAYFAAAQGSIIPQCRALDWLLSDNHKWLWAEETKREVMRLLVSLPLRLNEIELDELEQAILAGPPRDMFRDDIQHEEWQQIVDRDIWLRLIKVTLSGVVIGQKAKSRLDEISGQYPQWILFDNEREEFYFWMESGSPGREIIETPHSRRELVEWIKNYPSVDYDKHDGWKELCRNRFATSACVLFSLSRENIWPIDRWREALQAWSEEKLARRSWRYMGQILAHAPNEIRHSLNHGISWWLQAIAKKISHHESSFFRMCRDVLSLDYDDTNNVDPIGETINHPVGYVTQALLDWWYRQSPEDEQGLPDEIVTIFTELCNTQIEKFQYGRLLLSANSISLFRVDQNWTEQYLLPLFDWHSSEIEARFAWYGFLWSARLYRPLMEKIKPDFLDTVHHYDGFGEYGEQYAALLTVAGLDSRDTFTISELMIATSALPPQGLRSSVKALVQALASVEDERRKDYWNNRILPYLKKIWPKSREYITPAISIAFAELCLAAKGFFREAFDYLKPWLIHMHNENSLPYNLFESGICNEFPDSALAFLNLMEFRGGAWTLDYFKSCLEQIKSANPALEQDSRFVSLTNLLRQYG